MLKGELAAVVKSAVDALPEDQRLAVMLSKYEGLSYRELAEAMDRSVPAVKSLLVRARENLRTTLSPYLGKAPPDDDEKEDEMTMSERTKMRHKETPPKETQR